MPGAMLDLPRTISGIFSAMLEEKEKSSKRLIINLFMNIIDFEYGLEIVQIGGLDLFPTHSK